MMCDIKKKKYNRNIQFVANELACNIIDAKEKAKIVFFGNIIVVAIDKQTLSQESMKNLITAITISKEEKSFEIINLENKKMGGLGMRMITNLGYKLEYKESKTEFYLIAFKENE